MADAVSKNEQSMRHAFITTDADSPNFWSRGIRTKYVWIGRSCLVCMYVFKSSNNEPFQLLAEDLDLFQSELGIASKFRF